ncbi:hypothetical protein A5772_13910 [Mycolicibacter sinensis]|uniref:NUDIX hydrolase n=1 Tax=Mycolicibacter sinensis (strain JDM601) TaxID=875328 RepID=A0A1A2E5X3_MYCSD|nr:hypothetical protein A5772_13910 [Mycolicibacter sinensis]OBG00968.1 hypothetical protein A5771_18065 [Mycolicibacter sinensis]
MRVLGVDAAGKVWVGVELVDGQFARAVTAARLVDLPDLADYAVVAVDIPLGLLDKGFRLADTAARSLVGPRRSSVFLTAPRPVLLADSHHAASILHRQLTGMGLSQQSFALRTRIVEADALYSDDSLPLFEVHPELSFTMMGDGPPKAGKKSWHGQRDRMARLESAGIVIPAEIGDAGQAGPDDVLDAAAAAWSAHRIETHVACSVPDPPQSNERGQRMAIWY